MKQSRTGVNQRQEQILDVLNMKMVADVPYLSSLLKVSSATIRRDLRCLEAEGKIKRIYNGAKITDHFVKRGIHAVKRREKAAIAKYAASLVERNTTVFVNSGTTTYLIIENLFDKNVTVVTNNLYTVFKSLDSTPGIVANILLTGGVLHSGDNSLFGDFTMHAISSVISSQTFLGVTGISASGLTSISPEKALISNAMIDQCHGPKYVVIDSSKLGKKTNFYTCPLNKITCIITDTLADPEEVKKIQELGVEVALINPDTGEREQ